MSGLSRMLGLLNLAGFDRLNRNPHSFYLAAGEFHANTLKIRTESSFVVLNQLQADSACFFADALMNNASANFGSLSCNCTYSSHIKFEVKRIKMPQKINLTRQNPILFLDIGILAVIKILGDRVCHDEEVGLVGSSLGKQTYGFLKT